MCPIIIQQDDGSFKKRALDTEVSISGASGESGEAGTALGQPYWLHTEASDIGGYKKLLRGEPDQVLAGASETIEIADGPKLIEEFAMEPWEPSTTIIPAGWWHFTFRGYTGDPDEFSSYVARIYKRATGGAETLLYESVSPQITGTAAFPDQVIWREYFSESKGKDLDDRLVLKVYGITTSIGGITVGVQFEGTVETGSFIQTQIYVGESGESGQSGLSGESGLSGTYNPAPTLQDVTDEGNITDNDIGCEDLYLNQNGPDGDAFIYFYEGSSPPGAYLKWDNVDDRFELSHDMYIEGDVDVVGDSIRIGANNGPAVSSEMYFGSGGEGLLWDGVNTRFALSNDLKLNGDLILGDASPAISCNSVATRTLTLSNVGTGAFALNVIGIIDGTTITGTELRSNGDIYVNYDAANVDSHMYFGDEADPEKANIEWHAEHNRFYVYSTNGLHTITGEIKAATSLQCNTDIYLLNSFGEGDRYIYFYEGGSPVGASLMWDDSETEFLFSHHLKAPTLESAGAISAGAVITGGELKSNNDVYIKYAGGDGDSNLYFYENSSVTGAYLMWDDDPGEFVLSHNLRVDGGRIYGLSHLGITGNFDTGGFVWAKSGVIYLRNTEGDSYLYFYDGGVTSGESLMWDDSEDEFLFSNHLKVPTLESVGAITGASADFAGLLQCNSFRIDIAATAEVNTATHYVTMNINGTNYKVLLKSI